MEKYNNLYIVILAGGAGERLWPLSRKKLPKQLLKLHHTSLLDETIGRINGLTATENIWVLTTPDYQHDILSQTAGSVGRVVVEPGLRNTGPAILYASLLIHQINPHATIIFLPADAHIAQKDACVQALKHAAEFAEQHQSIVLLGHVPTFPATGYGYIEFDQTKTAENIFHVKKFHEKPPLAIAKKYCATPNFLWNIGIFCAQATVFIDEYQQHVPELYTAVMASLTDPEQYKNADSISIDYAIMEQSNNIHVQPVAFDWSDVGNLDVFLSLKEKYGASPTEQYSITSHNNLIAVPQKIVALIGINNLCVIETDDVLLIAQRTEIEDTKKLVHILREAKKVEFL